MKKLFLAFLFPLCFCGSLHAQGTGTTIRYGATLPATCTANAGQIFSLTSGTKGVYECKTANTWTIVGGGTGATLGADNTFTNNNRFQGPIPWRDATAYGAVSKTGSSGVACTAGSPSITITGAYSPPFDIIGDWANGEYMSIYGCGPLATVAAPNITPLAITTLVRSGGVVTATLPSTGPIDGGYLWVTGVADTTFNGLRYWTGGNLSTTITWNDSQANASSSGGTVSTGVAIYEGTNPGATTYTYNACTVGHGGGCSAKSATMTVASAPATLTDMDAIWTYWGFDFPTNGDYLCIYRNNSFIGRTHNDAGYKDDGTVWARNSNCPAAPPASATADTLIGRKILSGAGTSNLVLDGNAVTSVAINAYAFHDSAPAITAALAAAVTDNNLSSGGPEVILPAGNYQISRVDIDQYKLIATGSIRLTTHPIRVEGSSTFEGHGNNTRSQINYRSDQVSIISSDFLGGSIDSFVVPGGLGGNTISGAAFNSTTIDIVLASTPSAGSNGVTLTNIRGYHSTAGECLWADMNTIFVQISNWGCSAATVGAGAPINRYSIYMSNVSARVTDVVWDMKDIFMAAGSIWVDSPAPVIDGATAGFSFWRLSGFSSETVHSLGLFNIDAGCTTSPYNIITGVSKGIVEFAVGSDQAPYKGEYYFPRAGTTGCTVDQVHADGFAGSDIWITPRGSDPTVGASVPMVAKSLSTSIDGALLSADQDANKGETRVGGLRAMFGGIVLMRCVQAVSDTPCGAVMIEPADFSISDGGAGAGCGAGLTYYFQVSESDGIGWTKVGMQVRERSASTGAGGEIIRLTFAPGFIGPKYRVWFGTTSQAQTSYIETTNQSLDFVCQAATATGQIPPSSSNAYQTKLASESDVDSYLGMGTHDHFGVAKNPSTLGTTFHLDIGGLTNTDTSYNLNSKLIASATNPTIASGFGSSPSVVTPNGTVAFTVNVGTGGTATAGVITMPTAPTGWACGVNDITAAAAHVAYNTRQTASSVTSVTVENQTLSTGAAVAWAASDILRLECSPY